jgi:hypothetical protein
MKKIGFVILALILVLGTMGVAFSMWSQTVTVTGQVNTGNVKLTISDPTGTWAFKDMDWVTTIPGVEYPVAWVWGDQALLGNGQPDPAPHVGLYSSDADWTDPGDPGHVLIGWSVITGIDNATGTVTASWNNLFPVPVGSVNQYDPNGGHFGHFTADFDLTNSGSVPVRLKFSTPNPVSVFGMTVQIGYRSDSGGWYLADADAGDPGNNGSPWPYLTGLQLEPGDHVHMMVCLTPEENTTQGQSNGSFSFTITGVQWNEYVP